MSSWWIDTFIIMKLSSLSLVIIFALKSSAVSFQLFAFNLCAFIFKICFLQGACSWVLFFYLMWQSFLILQILEDFPLPSVLSSLAKHSFVMVWLILYLNPSLLLSNSFVHVCLRGILHHKGYLALASVRNADYCMLYQLIYIINRNLYLFGSSPFG